MQTKGVILAGGRSSRMGQDKAHIRYKGKTLLEHAEALLLELNVSQVCVIGKEDHPHGIKDAAPYAGPAAALLHWIKQQPTPFRLIVLPVDMPFLNGEQLQYLLSFEEGAYFDDLYLPFTCTLHESIVSDVTRMKDLLQQLQVKCVQPPQNWLKKLVNINEKSDLTLLHVPK